MTLSWCKPKIAGSASISRQPLQQHTHTPSLHPRSSREPGSRCQTVPGGGQGRGAPRGQGLPAEEGSPALGPEIARGTGLRGPIRLPEGAESPAARRASGLRGPLGAPPAAPGVSSPGEGLSVLSA
ncbi:hypothetical protein J1605_013239 [Eschrichtius robustus]|uniref:Uncharacterized protein n=1 Tax=Eschrichtius robustus TaxID=9764 RepID=A0AB34GJW0_ESCRO|nr:hypothetical protein J1605_013239 [Eschrichtius robustus]